MDSNWAGEQLQTIRTLMERSAIYRRALAPIMLVAGILGIITSVIAMLCHFDSARQFCVVWLATSVVAVAAALFLTRRQAIKDSEPFWSPPTRRVVQALAPPLLVGLLLGGFPVLKLCPNFFASISTIVWILFYGIALHAAGFFMPRGIRWFGWLFIALACTVIYGVMFDVEWEFNPNLLMGLSFGVLHLAYGTYLYVTDKGKNAV